MAPTHRGEKAARPALADRLRRSRATSARRQLAALWEELFGIAPIGIDDSFLELGGHSLLAIQMVTQIRALFEADLPVTALFEAPTIAELAKLCGRAQGRGERRGSRGPARPGRGALARRGGARSWRRWGPRCERRRAPLRPHPGAAGPVRGAAPQAAGEPGRQASPAAAGAPGHRPRPAAGDWPLSIDQERLWRMHRENPALVSWNVDAASRMRGRARRAGAPAAALRELIRRHAAWRATFPVVDGRPVQRVVEPAELRTSR